MTSSVDFKAAVRAGKLAEAFALAMSKAVELNITTWVASRGESTSREPKSGNRLRTRINLIEGAIENEIGDRFIGNGPYKELQEFHEQQVRDANYILENNLQSLQKLFRALAILKQQQLTNSSGKQALFPGEEVKAATTVKLQPEEGLPEKEDLEYPILTLADLEPEEEDNLYDEKSSDSSSRFNNSVIVTAPHNPQEVEKLASVAYEAPQQEAISQSDLYVAVAQSPSLDSETQPLDVVTTSESSSWESEEQAQSTVQPKISRRREDWETLFEVPKETDELVSESMEEEEEDWEEFSEDTTDTELILEQLKSVEGKKDEDWGDWMVEEEEFDLDLDSIPEVELSDTALEYALDLDRENQKNTNRPKEDNPE